jgi:hypothetical protein
MPGGMREAGEVNKQQTGGPKMKKFMMVIALLTAGLMASSTFAEVQNIRLSGDVRIRGYYNTYGGDSEHNSVIAQRTRITCEADLEDHVLVVVTLQSYGRWTEGASLNISHANRAWDVGMSEAYVQLNEMFFQAATLKLGRQYLHYGRGLIISSFENEKNFDAARLVLDYYPLTIDLVGALAGGNGAFAASGYNGTRTYLLFVNSRYEMTDSFIKAIEGYAGYMAPVNDNGTNNAPVIIGLRGDLNLTKNLQAWVEGAYETGKFPGTAGLREAFLANVGAQLSLGETQMSPALHVNYTFASGDQAGAPDDGDKAFSPWYELQPGYNGYLLKPVLSNIHIFNVGASIKPAKNTTAGVDVYYYMASTKNGSVSTGSADLGGFINPSLAGSSDIGWEVDATLGYDYSKDVRFQLITGLVIPGKAIRNAGQDDLAIGVRGEVAVKF